MKFMLSLSWNPYNPFSQYSEWKKFDTHEGFDTDGLLARALSTATEISDADQELRLRTTIDSIVNNPSFRGLYVMVEASD